jgi:hypothetical protein
MIHHAVDFSWGRVLGILLKLRDTCELETLYFWHAVTVNTKIRYFSICNTPVHLAILLGY